MTVTRAHVWEHLTRRGFSLDRFDHPLSLLNSGLFAARDQHRMGLALLSHDSRRDALAEHLPGFHGAIALPSSPAASAAKPAVELRAARREGKTLPLPSLPTPPPDLLPSKQRCRPEFLKDVRFKVTGMMIVSKTMENEDALATSQIPKTSLVLADLLGRRVQSVFIEVVEADRIKANLPELAIPLATALLGPIPKAPRRARLATPAECAEDSSLASVRASLHEPGTLNNAALSLELLRLLDHLLNLAATGCKWDSLQAQYARVSSLREAWRRRPPTLTGASR